MDGSVVEHSDSDSGESWTLLEGGPAYGDDAPDFAEHHPDTGEGFAVDSTEKDEDTDGISIISDSDPESSTPCDLTYLCVDEGRPTEPQIPEISLNTPPPNNKDDHKSVRGEEDFLGDGSGKLKTYVHRRNKRLSTMLNIIMLGSVITAAGVAVGHMWGARNECALSGPPSVNKILSNLYKLQEENAYLRAKLRDLTLLADLHRSQTERTAKNKCRKVFEGSLAEQAANPERLIKCVDNDTGDSRGRGLASAPAFEKDLLADLDKLKHVYQQNRSWLDDEIAKRLKQEELYAKKSKRSDPKSPKFTKNRELENRKVESPPEAVGNGTEPRPVVVEIVSKVSPDPRVTYADSLKSNRKVAKRDTKYAKEMEPKIHPRKRKPPRSIDAGGEASTDDELRKDDRYVGPRPRPDRRTDRAKTHKKQKRRNKYEQWEMKGGYLRDYEDFAVPSEVTLKTVEGSQVGREPERGAPSETRAEEAAPRGKDEASWYEKRAALRGEARRRLERELFGEAGAGASAQWYFKRMARREQCRARPPPPAANRTASRLAKRARNYKTKH